MVFRPKGEFDRVAADGRGDGASDGWPGDAALEIVSGVPTSQPLRVGKCQFQTETKNAEPLLFWLEGAESEFAHEQLGFVTVQRFKFHAGVGMALDETVANDEEVHATGFGGEVSGSRPQCRLKTHMGALPVGTKVMLAGFDSEIEVGVGLRGANPFAVEAVTRGGPGAGVEKAVVLEEIDERFAGIGLGKGMFGTVGLHIEFGVVGAAAGSGGGHGGRILRVNRSGKKQSNQG